MKTCKAILAGLVAVYATANYAQTAGGTPTARTEPITYREVHWTNGFGLQNPAELMHTEVPFSAIDLNITTVDVSTAWSNDYQVIVVFQDEEASDLAKYESDTAFITNLNTSLLSQLTASEMLLWRYGDTRSSTPGSSGAKKKPSQILVIEPLNTRMGTVPDQIKIHEYRPENIRSKPEWHEWFNPRLFLEKWAGYWSTETNATPVVLVLFTF